MPEILSECAPGLRLTRLPGPEGGFEVEAGGTVRRYADADLFGAIEHYMRALCQMQEPAAARALSVGVAVNIAMGARDFASLGDLVADDIAYVDHRPLGYEELNLDSGVQLMTEFGDQPNRYLARALHVAGGKGWVTTGGWWTRHVGDWREFEIGVTVCVVADGRLVRADLFAEESVDAALALFQTSTDS